MSDIENIIRTDLLDFAAYRSQANREEIASIWLNANESPYVHNFNLTIDLNRYPSRRPKDLLKALAHYYQVNSENLLLSRGSDEAIDLLIRLCCRAGQDSILICPPTFHMYQIYAKLQGAKVIEEPLLSGSEFCLPLSNILNSWQPNTKLIFICSPNNPTGHLSSAHEIKQLCAAVAGKAFVVVDEAYIEFSETSSLIDQLPQSPNLIILRTLSKAFGLAGTRCGVTIASPVIIEWLQKISSPYPLPTPTIVAALAALNEDNKIQIEKNIQQIIIQRKKLESMLLESPLIEHVWPSYTNFLLIKTTNAQKFLQHCLNHRIILRDYSQELNLENCVRITMGTPQEMDMLFRVVTDLSIER